jgi:hypothetical protein
MTVRLQGWASFREAVPGVVQGFRRFEHAIELDARKVYEAVGLTIERFRQDCGLQDQIEGDPGRRRMVSAASLRISMVVPVMFGL